MSDDTEVIIIGAGPYGLSVAAHLRARGIAYHLFGRCMEFWETQMPRGMLLKSDGYASNLSDPDRHGALKNFYAERGLTYADEGMPIPLETFVAYGHWFQQRLVPAPDPRLVTKLSRTRNGFVATLEDGASLTARQVVLAVGIGYFRYVPPVFAGLAARHLSHSSEHTDLGLLAGQEVCVVGGGASAIDTAALLHEAGAKVHLVARQIAFHDRTKLHGRPLWQRMVQPHSGIGAGWRPMLLAGFPLLFRQLPEARRRHMIEAGNGPAGGWAMRERVVGQFHIMAGYEPQLAQADGARVALTVTERTARNSTRLAVDHVIAATGYHNDLRRIPFLDPGLLAEIRTAHTRPVPALSADFETSVPGLFCVGVVAKYTFGPLLRFVFGAEFATGRTVRRISRNMRRRLRAVPDRAELRPAAIGAVSRVATDGIHGQAGD